MIHYKKVYINFFDYYEGEYIPSEISGGNSIDLHHLKIKGMGGSKKLDIIENLCALTREEHIRCHNDKEYNHEVQIKHLEVIRLKRPDYKMRPEYEEILKNHYTK